MNLKTSSALVILSIAIHPLFASAAKSFPTSEKLRHATSSADWAMCVIAPLGIGYVIEAKNINSSSDVDSTVYVRVPLKKQLMVKNGDVIAVNAVWGMSLGYFQAAGTGDVNSYRQIPYLGGIECYGTALSGACSVISEEDCRRYRLG